MNVSDSPAGVTGVRVNRKNRVGHHGSPHGFSMGDVRVVALYSLGFPAGAPPVALVAAHRKTPLYAVVVNLLNQLPFDGDEVSWHSETLHPETQVTSATPVNKPLDEFSKFDRVTVTTVNPDMVYRLTVFNVNRQAPKWGSVASAWVNRESVGTLIVPL
jgi:hypothetical protein